MDHAEAWSAPTSGCGQPGETLDSQLTLGRQTLLRSGLGHPVKNAQISLGGGARQLGVGAARERNLSRSAFACQRLLLLFFPTGSRRRRPLRGSSSSGGGFYAPALPFARTFFRGPELLQKGPMKQGCFRRSSRLGVPARRSDRDTSCLDRSGLLRVRRRMRPRVGRRGEKGSPRRATFAARHARAFVGR